MFAKESGRKVRGLLFAVGLVGVTGVIPAVGQTKSAYRKNRATAPPATAESSTVPPGQTSLPYLKQTAIPVNPGDPIAVINDEVITRSQLADECVARKGEEILETLIARRLIDQALRAQKLEVTAAEIDQEIDNVAMKVAGIGREAWLRTLDKERGISPVQYARDIIYPALALRKLAASRVQVTAVDMRNSFEAQYGDKLRCRMIMVDKLPTATAIWEELRKNPGGFEKIAMERSMDTGSRSLGGLLAEPISRHAYPQTVSDSAFSQLVDGDAKDKDPSHKPKDGDFTGPIQVAESTWILLRREGVEAAKQVDPKDKQVEKSTYEMIYEVKLKEAMGQFMVDLMERAGIDNKLTGRVKLANQAVDVDQNVKLMGGNRGGPAPSTSTSMARPTAAPAPAANPGAGVRVPTPAALSPEVVKQSDLLTRPSAKK